MKFVASVVCSAALTSVSLAQTAPTSTYMIGNSLTDGFVLGEYDQVSAGGGRPVTLGAHLIWGTPMDYMWEHGQPHDHNGNGTIEASISEEYDGGSSKTVNFGGDASLNRFWKVLPTTNLDVLTLQTFDRKAASDYQSFANYVNLLKLNPGNLNAQGKVKTKVAFFTRWPDRPTYKADVTPGDGINNPVTVGFGSFDLSQKWLDVNNTGTSEDDYTGVGWDEFTGNKARDYSVEMSRILRDPNSLGQRDPGTKSTATLALQSPVNWGLNRAQSLSIEHPANILANPIRLIPVADSFAEFERRLRIEAALIGISAVETKYGLFNTAEDAANGAKDPVAYTNLGDLNFAEHLFNDNVHLNSMGHYMQALAAYAVIYGADPLGVPPITITNPNAAYVALAQDVVWDVVQRDSAYTMVPEPTLALSLAGGICLLLARTRRDNR